MACLWTVLTVAVGLVMVTRADESSLEDVVKILKSQVTALLANRQEDYRMLEQSLLHTIEKNNEVSLLRAEVEKLRHDVSGSIVNNNEHITAQWATTTLSELRSEIAQLAESRNASADRAEREDLRAQLKLARADDAHLRRELERMRAEYTRLTAQFAQVRQNGEELRKQIQSVRAECRSVKKASKLSSLAMTGINLDRVHDDISNAIDPRSPPLSSPLATTPPGGPVRHNHLLRAQMQQLRKLQLQMQRQIRRLEDERTHDRNEASIESSSDVTSLEERVATLENTSRSMAQAVWNATRQAAGVAALRSSSLQLLESLESLEAKVDTAVPGVQREISRLEFNLAETRALAKENSEDVAKLQVQLKKQVTLQQSAEERAATTAALAAVLESQMYNLTERIEVLEASRTAVNASPDGTLSSASGRDDTEAVPSELQEHTKDVFLNIPKDCNNAAEVEKHVSTQSQEKVAPCENGWVVVQRRLDGTVDFNRTWAEYKRGFGSATGEFWLGNEAIHQLTSDGCAEMRVEFEDIFGRSWVVEYKSVTVGPESDYYRLRVSHFNGNASDALAYQNGAQFSAPDEDRDSSHSHCARNYEAGWWFSHCQHANLNGRYNVGLTWFDSYRNEWIAVSRSAMKIRRSSNCEISASSENSYSSPGESASLRS